MKKILTLNDISAVGNCSTAVNLPILSVMGHCVYPVVTSAFSCQTGFHGFHYISNDQLEVFADDVIGYGNPDIVYVGFCTSTQQLDSVIEIVKKMKSRGKMTVVDPIMGDNGKLYPIYNKQYVVKMKQLVSLADFITPNLTEACLLTDRDFVGITSQSNQSGFLARVGETFSNFCTETGAKSAIITGVVMPELIGNIVLQDGVRYVTNQRTDINYSGTGDVFSSVVTGAIANGETLVDACRRASAFIVGSIARTECKDSRFGIEFQRNLHSLVK